MGSESYYSVLIITTELRGIRIYSERELLVSACSVVIRSLYSGHSSPRRSASKQPMKVVVEKQFALQREWS
jgi:hypothetical protein